MSSDERLSPQQQIAIAAPLTPLADIQLLWPAIDSALPEPTTLLVIEPAPQPIETLAAATSDEPAGTVAGVAGEHADSEGADKPEVSLRPDCDASHSPLYCVYEVQPGDTLSSIARRFELKSTDGVAAYDMLVQSNRPALAQSTDVLEAGERIRVPVRTGIVHTVLGSETLAEIALRFGVAVAAIVDVPENNILDANALRAGQDVLVPDPQLSGAQAALPRTRAASSESGFTWPAGGEITSTFGPSHPLGIDIALMPGDPVVAAADGTVIFAGGDECCSYGLFVVIVHPGGIETLYGHLSVLQVETGDKVERGEQIGLGGSTGYGTGPHVHFETHQGTTLVDPLSLLP
jgi:murein DD-endopeptidase MepM/ murein hydrolase activator NlpD